MSSDSLFHHIDPVEVPMTVVAEIGKFGPLNMGRYYATIWFGVHDENFIDEITIDEIEETIRIVQKMLKEERSILTEGNMDIYRPSHFDGEDLLDHLKYQYPVKTNEFRASLHTGRIIGEIDLLCAMALLQLERTAESMEKEKARLVGYFMLDTYNLVDRIKKIVNTRDEKEFISRRAKINAGKRHEKTYKIQDEAIRLYKSKKRWRSTRNAASIIYPDVAEYAKKIGQPLSQDRGPKTIYDYLRAYVNSHS